MIYRFLLSVICLGITAGLMAQTNIPYQDISQRTSRRTNERNSSRSTNSTRNTGATPTQQNANNNTNTNSRAGNSRTGNQNDGNAKVEDNGVKSVTGQAEKNSRTATRTVTTGGNSVTSGSKTVARPPDVKKPTKAAAGRQAPSSGPAIEVNEGMLQALRTQTVEFDPDEMANTEGVIMLNPRKYETEGKRSRSSDIAQPL